MDHSAIVNELIVLLNKTLDKERELSETTQLISEIGLESIQVIEYLCEVEDRFDLIIDENAISTVETVGDLAQVVAKLKNNRTWRYSINFRMRHKLANC